MASKSWGYNPNLCGHVLTSIQLGSDDDEVTCVQCGKKLNPVEIAINDIMYGSTKISAYAITQQVASSIVRAFEQLESDPDAIFVDRNKYIAGFILADLLPTKEVA